VREFEQTALIKEPELQLSIVDEGVDLLFNGCSPLPFWIPEEKQMVEYFQPKM
jgi:hypothetical protein